MSSNIKALGARNNLKNVPHMLRNLADGIERHEEPMPLAMLVVSIYSLDAIPEVYCFGDELGRVVEIGALHSAAGFLGQMGVES